MTNLLHLTRDCSCGRREEEEEMDIRCVKFLAEQQGDLLSHVVDASVAKVEKGLSLRQLLVWSTLQHIHEAVCDR